MLLIWTLKCLSDKLSSELFANVKDRKGLGFVRTFSSTRYIAATHLINQHVWSLYNPFDA